MLDTPIDEMSNFETEIRVKHGPMTLEALARVYAPVTLSKNGERRELRDEVVAGLSKDIEDMQRVRDGLISEAVDA